MPGLKSLTIRGYRGFAEAEQVRFAIPNGQCGSGLTIIVGPNNAGKSTVIESLHAIAERVAPSFTEGKRNQRAGDRVSLTLGNEVGQKRILASVPGGGSETQWTEPNIDPGASRFLVLPSRRSFAPMFGKEKIDRSGYMSRFHLPAARGSIPNFSARLFTIQDQRAKFDEVLRRVIDPVPDWYIDQYENSNYYLKVRSGQAYHNSDGLGDGLVSTMFIVDALYDSAPGDIIAFDEPELSLHPTLQKRLCQVLADYAKDRQIIYATHSPYFINWQAIFSGGSIVRVKKIDHRSVVTHLSDTSRKAIAGLTQDLNNPHVLGLDASEIFFIEDGVVLVEGQEDVLCYAKILKELDVELPGTFFGWGVGGAPKMPVIAQMLCDLGFERVAGILDQNQAPLRQRLSEEFPSYNFEAIPAEDVRTKKARPAKQPVKGLLDENGTLRQEYSDDVHSLFLRVRRALQTRVRGEERHDPNSEASTPIQAL